MRFFQGSAQLQYRRFKSASRLSLLLEKKLGLGLFPAKTRRVNLGVGFFEPLNLLKSGIEATPVPFVHQLFYVYVGMIVNFPPLLSPLELDVQFPVA